MKRKHQANSQRKTTVTEEIFCNKSFPSFVNNINGMEV